MKITIVTTLFPPEIGGAVHLIYELARSLNDFGHKVHILTGFPHYNIKPLRTRASNKLIVKEYIGNLQVTRLRFPYFSARNKIVKGLQHLNFGFWLAVLTLFSSRSDVILTFSPPLPVPWLVCWIGKLRHIPVVVSIQDLFPLEAVELGMLSNPMAIRIFEKMEYQMAANATGLTVHSPGNIKHIVKHGGHAGCIDVVYNWVDPTRIKPKPKLNSFAQNYKLTDLFVVSYAGTMGWAQDMMTIVKSAALLRDEPKIVFLLVGDGVEKQKAQEEGKRLKLQNIVWLPMQPWRVYPEILASSNLSMINLHPSLKTPVVPSKLISIMAAARPVIACLPAESDARKIIDKAGCGLCVDAGDAKALSTAIIELSSNPELAKQLGHKGRIYMESNFARSVCTRKMEAVLILARRKSKYFTSKHSLLL